MWSDDSGDSFAAPPTSEKMIEAFNQYPPQSNILCHETKSTTTQEVCHLNSHNFSVALYL